MDLASSCVQFVCFVNVIKQNYVLLNISKVYAVRKIYTVYIPTGP